MSAFASWSVARRAAGARWVLAGAFVLLIGAFFRAQVLRSTEYRLDSKSNRLRAIPLPAPRGEILDREGRPIAENAPGYSIRILASSSSDLRRLLIRLDSMLPARSIDIDGIVDRWSAAPFVPVLVYGSSDFSLVSRLEEHRAALPGLVIASEPRRVYPDSALVGHLAGYIGEIDAQQLESGHYRNARMGDQVGRSGLELEYDSLLRGGAGVRFVEVSANNRLVHDPGEGGAALPIPGQRLRTTIDLPLQRFVDSMWRANPFLADKRGALLAMRPDGAVLAYYSHPTFDPNEWVDGISTANYARLRTPEKPLLNRVIYGAYPPASPFKLAIAAMALKRGLVTMDTHMAQPCTGSYVFGGRRYRCWKPEGHGSLDLRGAIATSCDVYFYQLGLKLGADKILENAHDFGFGDVSGIDLPGEQQPTLFHDLDEYVKRRGAWNPGETLNLAIGQGANAQTLVNMVSFYAALASDGIRRPPYLVAPDPSVPPRDLGLSPAELNGLRQAMRDVVNQGTAGASGGAAFDVAGKTGTGQMSGGQQDAGWFIGFAPASTTPQIVVGILVEEGIHGSLVAPYVVQTIRRFLFGPDTTVLRQPINLPITENLGTRDQAGADSVLPDSARAPLRPPR